MVVVDQAPAGHGPGPKSKSRVVNGRQVLGDPTLRYPFAIDLPEVHRQSQFTLLALSLHGSPVLNQELARKPPRRVLELGCGSGLWSMMCHRYFQSHGHNTVSFVGLDVHESPAMVDHDRDDMYWQFVQHDFHDRPWPLESHTFDLVMYKDLNEVASYTEHIDMIDEVLRILRPGGIFEVWDRDSTIRRLTGAAQAALPANDKGNAFHNLGVYCVDASTLSPPANPHIAQYNAWLTQAMLDRDLNPCPCTVIGPFLVQDPDQIGGLIAKRYAVPLSTDIAWETPDAKDGALNHDQRAVRNTALDAFVQLVAAYEPLLRSAGKMNQESWDLWFSRLVRDLMLSGGANQGECLEIGAWSVRKKKN